jgi:hypothetical protein
MLRCSPGTHRFPVSASVRGDVANRTPYDISVTSPVTYSEWML